MKYRRHRKKKKDCVRIEIRGEQAIEVVSKSVDVFRETLAVAVQPLADSRENTQYLLDQARPILTALVPFVAAKLFEMLGKNESKPE